jgi:hypothetical protein
MATAAAALSACSASDAPAATAAPSATARPATRATATPSLGAIGATPGPLSPFTLPRAGGGQLALSDYIGRQPVSVVFYRGFF